MNEFEFSGFRCHVPNKTPNVFKKGSENGTKMEPRFEKTMQKTHLGRYKNIGSKHVQKESRGGRPGALRAGLGAPNKENNRESGIEKGSIGGTGIVQGIMKRPLVPEGTVAVFVVKLPTILQPTPEPGRAANGEIRRNRGGPLS